MSEGRSTTRRCRGFPPSVDLQARHVDHGMEPGVAWTIECRSLAPRHVLRRYFRCWEKKVTAPSRCARRSRSLRLVYFYQLGLRIGLTNLLAGGVKLQFRERSGIDLPSESRSIWPYAVDYFNRRYGPGAGIHRSC